MAKVIVLLFAIVACSQVCAAQNILLVGNPGSLGPLPLQTDTLDNIAAYMAATYPAATLTHIVEGGCTGVISAIDATTVNTYDIIIYMKFADWTTCNAAARPGIEAYADAGGVFLFAGSSLPLTSMGVPESSYPDIFGATPSVFQVDTLSFVSSAACDGLTDGASTSPIGSFGILENAPIACALSGPGAAWLIAPQTTGAGIIASIADDTNTSLFNNDASYNNVIDNLVAPFLTNGGTGDPHLYSNDLFGSGRDQGQELVSLLESHNLATRSSLLATPTWLEVASAQAETLCLLGDGLRSDGTYFTGLRVLAGDDGVTLLSQSASGDDLVLAMEASDGSVVGICARGSDQPLAYDVAGGLAHVTVTCDVVETQAKFGADHFMMAHSNWLQAKAMARIEVRTADYSVVAYYIQQNYVASKEVWVGEANAFFNVEVRPQPHGIYSGLFGNSLGASLQELRDVTASPMEAEARMVASFLRQE